LLLSGNPSAKLCQTFCIWITTMKMFRCCKCICHPTLNEDGNVMPKHVGATVHD
jgi:hypothetical protein